MKKIVVFLSLLIVFQLKVSGVVYASDSLSEEARLAAIAASEAAARAAQANNEVDDARFSGIRCGWCCSCCGISG